MSTRLSHRWERLRPHAARAGWAGSEALVGPVLLLLVAPWLLRHLGAAGFGLWALAQAIVSFGYLASLGVGVTTTRHVAADLAQGEPQRAVSAVRAGLSVALGIGAVLLAGGALASPWIAGAVFPRMGPTATVALTLSVGLAMLVLQEIDSVFSGALRGAGRFDLVAGIELATRPLWALAVCAAASLTGDANLSLLAGLAVNGLRLVVKAAAASRRLGRHCHRPSRNGADIARLVRVGGWVWVQGLGSVIYTVGDRLLVGALLGASELGRYTLCMQLSHFIHSLQAAALQTLLPWVSGAPDRPGRMRRIRRVAWAAGIAATIAPMLLAAAGHTLLSLWIGPEFADDNATLLFALFCSVIVLSLSTPTHFALIGLGDVRFLGLLGIAAGVAALGVSTLLSVATSLGFLSFAIGRNLYGVVMLASLSRLYRERAEAPPGRS